METKNTIIPYKMICHVQSHSHKLNKESFSFLMTDKSNIIISDVKEKSFLLTCLNMDYDISPKKFVLLAHLCLSNFIMALNIATLGHFTWNLDIFSPQPYLFIEPNKDTDKIISTGGWKFKKEFITDTVDIRNITSKDIDKAVNIYIALAEERDLTARFEYIKGILHLSFNFFDINFHREAFGNFYRSFENFATERILNVRKLSNELKQLKNVIINLGLGDDIAEEFHSLYKIRSSQIMHAQKMQVKIKIGDAFKMKLISDAVIQKVYKPIWEKIFNEADIIKKLLIYNKK